MSNVLLPQAFWFRMAIACQRIDGLPHRQSKLLLDLPEHCRVLQTSRLDGREPWADVRAAWNPSGLALSVEAEGTLSGLMQGDRPECAYGIQVMLDTRDTRDLSRATRFCHRFDAKLSQGSKKGELVATVEQRPIVRAIADAPLAKSENMLAKANRTKISWQVEFFIEAAALNGFEPETNRRLGFCYRIFDPDRTDEILGASREFPVSENPSLWSTLELWEPE